MKINYTIKNEFSNVCLPLIRGYLRGLGYTSIKGKYQLTDIFLLKNNMIDCFEKFNRNFIFIYNNRIVISNNDQNEESGICIKFDIDFLKNLENYRSILT